MPVSSLGGGSLPAQAGFSSHEKQRSSGVSTTEANVSLRCHSQPTRLGEPARQFLVALNEEPAVAFILRLTAALWPVGVCALSRGRLRISGDAAESPAFALHFRRGGACPACTGLPWRATLRVASIRCRISGIARDLISVLAVVGPDRFYRAVAVHRTALAPVRQARGQLWCQLALLNAALAAEVRLTYEHA